MIILVVAYEVGLFYFVVGRQEIVMMFNAIDWLLCSVCNE